MEKEFKLHGFPVEVGDKVFSLVQGWGEVTSITRDWEYPIHVTFGTGIMVTFAEDGKMLYTHVSPTLLWHEVIYELPAKPCPPVYEYKILYLNNVSEHNLTSKYYTSLDEYLASQKPVGKLLSLFEPSKRVRTP